VPIVAAAVGGIPEIVQDGRSGVLIPCPPEPELVTAAMAPLLDDGAERRRLAEAGRVRFERDFTAEAWGMRMRSVYEAAIRRGASDG